MTVKDKEGRGIKGEFSGLEFIGRQRKMRGDKKRALNVQLCHAMDQIIIDVKQVLEVNARDTFVAPAGE